jgi:DNA-binding transcriptional LysR family regulator
VSQSLTTLEASLGTKLFDRVRKELVLTRGGQQLHAHVADYQQLLARALAELSGDSAEVTGTIRLGLFLGFPRVRSRELLVTFAERYPRAVVRVVYAPQRDLEARLSKNKLDYVLSFAPSSRTAPDLTSKRLFAQELVLVTSAHFFKHGFSVRELATTPVVDYYQSDPLIARWLAHHFPNERVAPNVRFWAATTDLVHELVQSGAGVGVMPHHMLNRARRRRPARADSDGLREIGPPSPLIDHVWLNEPRQAHRDPAQRAFREVLLSVLAEREERVRRR